MTCKNRRGSETRLDPLEGFGLTLALLVRHGQLCQNRNGHRAKARSLERFGAERLERRV